MPRRPRLSPSAWRAGTASSTSPRTPGVTCRSSCPGSWSRTSASSPTLARGPGPPPTGAAAAGGHPGGVAAGTVAKPFTTSSRYVSSGHQLRDTSGPRSTLTSGLHQIDRACAPGPAHQRAHAYPLRSAGPCVSGGCSSCLRSATTSVALHRGHRYPSGQRDSIRYSRQASSSGSQRWNSTMLRGK